LTKQKIDAQRVVTLDVERAFLLGRNSPLDRRYLPAIAGSVVEWKMVESLNGLTGGGYSLIVTRYSLMVKGRSFGAGMGLKGK